MSRGDEDLGIFPEYLYDLFSKEKLDALPILDMASNMGDTDYIDFLKPEDLSQPIMKGIDKYKRQFITFLFQQRNKQRVITFFQRYSDSKNFWVYGGSPFIDLDGANGINLSKESISRSSWAPTFLSILQSAIAGDQTFTYKALGDDNTLHEHICTFPGVGG